MNCPRIQHNCILHTGRGHKQRRKRATSIIHPLFGLCTRNTIEFFLRYMIRQRVLRLSVQLSGLYCSRSIPFLFPFLSGGSFDETPRFCCAFSFFGNRPFSTNETRPWRSAGFIWKSFRRPSAVLALSLPPAGWLAGLMLTSSTMLSERLAPISGLSFVLFRFFFFVFNFSFDDVQSTNHSSAPDAYRSKPLFILNFQNYVFLYLFESA